MAPVIFGYFTRALQCDSMRYNSIKMTKVYSWTDQGISGISKVIIARWNLDGNLRPSRILYIYVIAELASQHRKVSPMLVLVLVCSGDEICRQEHRRFEAGPSGRKYKIKYKQRGATLLGHRHQGKFKEPSECNIGQYLWKIWGPYRLQAQLSLFSIHQLTNGVSTRWGHHNSALIGVRGHRFLLWEKMFRFRLRGPLQLRLLYISCERTTPICPQSDFPFRWNRLCTTHYPSPGRMDRL